MVGSPEYQTLAGLGSRRRPEDSGKSRGALVGMTIEPGTVRLGEPGPRQLRVMAQYEDGHQRDVTRLATYRVNDDSAAAVNHARSGRAPQARRDRRHRPLSIPRASQPAGRGRQPGPEP